MLVVMSRLVQLGRCSSFTLGGPAQALPATALSSLHFFLLHRISSVLSSLQSPVHDVASLNSSCAPTSTLSDQSDGQVDHLVDSREAEEDFFSTSAGLPPTAGLDAGLAGRGVEATTHDTR